MKSGALWQQHAILWPLSQKVSKNGYNFPLFALSGGKEKSSGEINVICYFVQEAVWRSVGSTDEGQKIVIPFFSLLVKDLYFLNEACATK